MESKHIQRLQTLENHIQSNKTYNLERVPEKSDDDVVIVAFARTALTKAKKGPQRDTAPEVMLSVVLKDVIAKSGIDSKLIDDICVGNVCQPGGGAHTSRMGSFLAGIPDTVSLSGVNRQCSSGLQAVINITNAIKAKQINIGIGAGVEQMSLFPMDAVVDPNIISPLNFECPGAANCLMGMGFTSDNVAEKFKITREEQDQMAVESHQKAAHAQKEGWFAKEITVYKTFTKDAEGNETEVVVDKDDGIRGDTTVEGLKKLKSAFIKGGTTTAGNSSQVTDGAAAVLLMRRDIAKKLGMKIQGRVIGYAVAGVPPEIMGIGPAVAIPAALKKAGLTVNDIDIYEINEAFASQATYSYKILGIPKEKLNPRGGAIAIGHPLGATGARQVVTLFNELERTNKKYGVISMCIGTGMGAAGVFERE